MITVPQLTRLTSNFLLSEFACPCCSRVSADFRLVSGLQGLRDAIQRPLVINSAFRCEKHNLEVGGAANSQHKIGTAADIHVPGMKTLDLLLAAESVRWLQGFGYGEKYLHVDVRTFREYWYYNRGVAIPCTRERLIRFIAGES